MLNIYIFYIFRSIDQLQCQVFIEKLSKIYAYLLFVLLSILYYVCLSIRLSSQQILEGYILFLAPIYDKGMISWCWFLLSKSTYSTIFVLLVCQLCNMKFGSLKITHPCFVRNMCWWCSNMPELSHNFNINKQKQK